MKEIKVVMFVLLLAHLSWGKEPPKTPPAPASRVAVRNLPNFERGFQIGYALGPSLLAPAGIVFTQITPEFYFLKNLGVGFEFNIGYYEGDYLGLMIDFANVKYVIIPRDINNLTFHIRTGFGLGVAVNGATAVSFDWAFGSGTEYWFNRTLAFSASMNTHTMRGDMDGTVFNILFGVRVNIDF